MGANGAIGPAGPAGPPGPNNCPGVATGTEAKAPLSLEGPDLVVPSNGASGFCTTR